MKNENVMSLRTGLAGAMALAAGTSAYAAIVPVGVPANLPAAPAPASNPATGTLGWDVDGNGTLDFGFQFRNPQANPGPGVQWQGNFNPLIAGNAVVGYTGAFIAYANNLATNTSISGASTFRPTSGTGQVTLGSVYRSNSINTGYGGFFPGNPNTAGGQAGASRGFAGFRFATPGGVRYGWIELQVDATGISFFRAAYEDSGAAIPAGTIPAPTSIGALALGAAALLRRNRKVA